MADKESHIAEFSEPHSTAYLLFSSPIVILIVGPDKHVLKAHEFVLTPCGYFVNCLRQNKLQGAVTNEILLPDEDPGNIAKILNWLYTLEPERSYVRAFWASLDSCLSLSDKEELLERLIVDYTLAKRYLFREISDAILQCDSFQRLWETGLVIDWKHFQQLQTAGLRDSSLWTSLVSLLAGMILRGQCDLKSSLDERLYQDHDLLQELFFRLSSLQFE
ncbi:hypothetical protein A1O1_00837 [Capronia coronata CBS 617.96]|uniref:BTB domain-containing protein n=1 Tax=Capronia coronata CBS 617.96 TaxID=1182541 RepID=W9ZMI1_9EURO|nr:uncharacterized protein A1O1_00837 [Capronia coronata CBS 617.96]EXJ95714.1 hypothetical protein A1O1_00837 [Capronia coronata CBS 617.96]